MKLRKIEEFEQEEQRSEEESSEEEDSEESSEGDLHYEYTVGYTYKG